MACCRDPVFGWVALHALLSCSRLRVWGFMAGCRAPLLSGVWASWLAVVLPCFQACGLHGLLLCSCSRCRRSLEASVRILQPGTQAGACTHPSVRRRSRLDGSLSGFFLIDYSSICQLFKFSYRMTCAKVFTGGNLIKTLFSTNYRGYFIIQAAHLTLNYSYFLHKTGRKYVETNKIVQNHHKNEQKVTNNLVY